MAVLVGLSSLIATGCWKRSPPPVVPVSGTVTIEGKPLPSALVTFYPTFEGFGGEIIAEGVSDGQGRYTLTCALGNGACIGRHKVTVANAPMPEDARDQTAAAHAKMRAFQQSLTNRPIGTRFGTLATTPLEVDVQADGGSYDLKLSR
jgi:hypothetical protein